MKKFIKKILILTVATAMVVTAMPLTGIDFGEMFNHRIFAFDEVFDEPEEPEEPESYYFDYGDFYCRKTKEDVIIIYKYNGSDAIVEIPSEIDGYPVTKLGFYSFSPNSYSVNNIPANEGLYNLKKIVIPSSVKEISSHAFFSCTNLETVILFEGLEILGDSAFDSCTSLSLIELPASLEKIGSFCFSQTLIEAVIFRKNPKNIFRVSNMAFGYSNIKKCIFQSDNTVLNYDAFELSVVEEVIFEGSVSVDTSYSAFRGSDSVQKIVCLSDVLMTDFAETLVNEEGYYLHVNVTDDYIYFDRNPEETGLITSRDFIFGINSDNEAVILGYNGTNPDVVIPENINGFTVTEIGPYAFNNWLYEYEENAENTFLTSVTIPETVTAISAYAFNNNRKLKSVNLHGKLETIEEYAFRYAGISEAIIPESVKSVGVGAFLECPELEYAVVPQSIRVLKDGTFAMCPKLAEVSLPEGLETIELSCFIDTPLLTIINIPSTVKEIGNWAFENSGIENVVLPECLEFLGESAFVNSGAKNVVINGKNLIISEHAFNGCLNLETLELGTNIKEIGDYAFMNCSSLKSVTIPESVEKIGSYPFRGCTELTTVYYNAVNAYIETFSNNAPKYPIFYECNNIIEVYIGNKVEYIGKKVFAELKNLKTVHMSDSVKIIDTNAFSKCTSLKSINLPANAEKINSYAFSQCKSLDSVTIPANVKSLSLYAFDSCPIRTINYYPTDCDIRFYQIKNNEGINYSPFYQFRATLTEFNLGEGFTEIPDNYFCGLTNLTKVTIPDTIESIGNYAFCYCKSLNHVEISDNTEEIGNYAFYGCKSLKSINIPSSIKDINEYCFAYTGIESFSASSAFESIGDGCFKGCSQLTEINLGNTIILGESVFEDCTALTVAVIPDSVSNIGKRTFKNCSVLTTVYMSENVKYISDECFYECAALKNFVWESDSKLIGIRSFAYCANLEEFNFENLKKLYDNSFLNSGVAVVQLGEAKNETASELKEIETQSFMACDNLSTLAIGGNVTTIKTQAFADCANLETAVISDSVTEIADDAFEGCDKLTIYCTSGSYVETYATENNIKVSTLVIAPIPNQTYTGKEIKPSVSVSYSDESLDKSDYTVSYSNNINVGTAKVSVTGTGIFKYLTSKAAFEIIARKISDAVISDISDREYTGNAITPEISVVYNGITLKKGVDYTVSYSDNTDIGTAYVNIKGIGNFKGDAKISFEIIKKDGQSSDNPPVDEPPVDNGESFFDKLVDIVMYPALMIFRLLAFIVSLF